MGLPTGQYSKNIYDPFKRYWGALLQESKPAKPIPWVDADFNDHSRNVIENIRRFRHEVFEDGTPGATEWLATESVISNVNNFEVQGGDGTQEGAGRYYLGGMTAVLPDDIEFDPDDSTGPAGEMDYVHHRNTDLTDTVLTDLDANYTVNELVGRDLVPKVDEGAPVTRFAIISNTATTITVAGGLLAVAVVGDFYMVAPSTPPAAPATRTDTVYLDVYLDEYDAVEDTDLLHAMAGVVGGIEACRRLKLIQQIHVNEGGTYGTATYTSAAGNRHYRVPIAQFTRNAADATITAAMITDLRPVPAGYGSSHEVILARDSTVYATAYDTLDDRLEFVEDDALDAHDFIDTGRADGTTVGGALTGIGLANLAYAAWEGYVDAEHLTVGGGAVAIGGFPNDTYWIYVDSAGAIQTQNSVPAAGAILGMFDVAAGLITDIWDWRFWLNTLDYKNEIVVGDPTGDPEEWGNIYDLQAAIDYAIARGYGTVRVKAGTYSSANTITIADVVTTGATYAAEDLRVVFEPGAILEPSAAVSALEITSAERIYVEGVKIVGTNMGGANSGITLNSCIDIHLDNIIVDGSATAGYGISFSTTTRLYINHFQCYDIVTNGIQHAAGISSYVNIEHSNVRAGSTAIDFNAGIVSHSLINNTFVGDYTAYGIRINSTSNNIVLETIITTFETSNSALWIDGSEITIRNAHITTGTYTQGGIRVEANADTVRIEDSYIYNNDASSAIHIDTADDVIIENVHIDENSLAHYPIYVDSATNVRIDRCTLEDVGTAAIYVDGAEYVDIVNNYITDASRYGIWIEATDSVNISENNFVDVVDVGGLVDYISIVGCDAVQIRGNEIAHLIGGVATGITTLDDVGTENTIVEISDNLILLGAADIGMDLGLNATDYDFVVTGNIIFFIGGGTQGIFLNNLSNSLINDNTVWNAAEGIGTTGSTLTGTIDTTIEDNHVYDCVDGIVMTGVGCVGVLIEGNEVRDASNVGITANFLLGPVSVVGNIVNDPGDDGILSSAGNSIIIEGNFVYSAAAEGIELDNSLRSTVVGNLVNTSTSAGIYLNTCSRTAVTGNTCVKNGAQGITDSGGSYNAISGNSCSDNTGHGINIFNTDSDAVNGNTCYNNGVDGIYVQGDYNTCCGNNCDSNADDGIEWFGDWGSISGNVCCSNGDVGIEIPAGSTDNSVVGNTAQNNGDPADDIHNVGTDNGLGVTGTGNNCFTYNTAPVGRITG